jgi:hypothetical protein
VDWGEVVDDVEVGLEVEGFEGAGELLVKEETFVRAEAGGNGGETGRRRGEVGGGGMCGDEIGGSEGGKGCGNEGAKSSDWGRRCVEEECAAEEVVEGVGGGGELGGDAFEESACSISVSIILFSREYERHTVLDPHSRQ